MIFSQQIEIWILTCETIFFNNCENLQSKFLKHPEFLKIYFRLILLDPLHPPFSPPSWFSLSSVLCTAHCGLMVPCAQCAPCPHLVCFYVLCATSGYCSQHWFHVSALSQQSHAFLSSSYICLGQIYFFSWKTISLL